LKLRYETQEAHLAHLMSMIDSSKDMISALELLQPDQEAAELIEIEKDQIAVYRHQLTEAING
jgi:hypothetical protein